MRRSSSQKEASRKLLRLNVTPGFYLTYSENGGNLGLVLKMKNVACISILFTKHVKNTYLYLFNFILYGIVAIKKIKLNGHKQLYNDNLRKLPNEYGDVSVMFSFNFRFVRLCVCVCIFLFFFGNKDATKTFTKRIAGNRKNWVSFAIIETLTSPINLNSSVVNNVSGTCVFAGLYRPKHNF